VNTDEGGLFLFFGAQVDGLSEFGKAEKDERIKELFCIYAVAEWIEVSASIKEFFTHLPSTSGADAGSGPGAHPLHLPGC